MKRLIVLSVPVVLSLFLFGCTQLAGSAEPQPSACRNHRYFPLRLGAHWEYLWESDFPGSISEIERYEVTELNVDHGTTAERRVWLALPPLDIPEENSEVPFRCYDTGITTPLGVGYMPYDLTRGLAWSDPFSTQEVREELQAADNLATITVPAGTFEALCITIKWTSPSSPSPDSYYPSSGQSCYAEGIGLVYEEYTAIRPRDGDTTNDALRLVSYTIPAQ